MFSVTSFAEGSGRIVDFEILGGSTLIAEFNIVDGDIFTFVNIITSSNRFFEPSLNGGQTSDRLAVITIEQSRLSTGDVLIGGLGSTTDFVFTIGKNLDTARVQATMMFEDNSTLTKFEVTMDVTWTSRGAPMFRHSHEEIRNVGFILKTGFVGWHRNATATGYVKALNGCAPPRHSYMNFTTQPSSSAEIQRNPGGFIQIDTD